MWSQKNDIFLQKKVKFLNTKIVRFSCDKLKNYSKFAQSYLLLDLSLLNLASFLKDLSFYFVPKASFFMK